MKNLLSRWGTAALIAAALVVAGCGSGSSGDTASGTTGTTGTTGTSGAPAGAASLTGKKVGFSQIGAESAWRTANTQSIKDEAAKRGVDLKFADAQQKQENQIKAIRSFIAQKVDVIAFSPVVETGWTAVLKEAKDAKIPVIVSDRRPDVPDDMYVTFIGSDFVEEGKRAADWLVKKTGGKAVIAEIEGTAGSAPANDRKKGFDDVIKQNPGMSIVFSQTGEFTRAKGKEVAEALLKSPQGAQITAIFAHNDDMALGAIQAIEEAGKKPGKDIVVVSIDGIKDALQAIKDGKLGASVECNPLLGPALFDAIQDTLAGKSLPKRTVMKDDQFDETNAATALPNRKY